MPRARTPAPQCRESAPAATTSQPEGYLFLWKIPAPYTSSLYHEPALGNGSTVAGTPVTCPKSSRGAFRRGPSCPLWFKSLSRGPQSRSKRTFYLVSPTNSIPPSHQLLSSFLPQNPHRSAVLERRTLHRLFALNPLRHTRLPVHLRHRLGCPSYRDSLQAKDSDFLSAPLCPP